MYRALNSGYDFPKRAVLEMSEKQAGTLLERDEPL